MTVDRRIDAFESTLRSSREWVADYAEKLGQDHPELAFRCLRAALHAIRDRLRVEDAAALAAQLPMLVRGAFYEGYRPAHVPIAMRTADELHAHVGRELAGGLAAPPADVMRAAFALLNARVDAGEVRKVRQVLPAEIRQLWPEPAAHPQRPAPEPRA